MLCCDHFSCCLSLSDRLSLARVSLPLRPRSRPCPGDKAPPCRCCAPPCCSSCPQGPWPAERSRPSPSTPRNASPSQPLRAKSMVRASPLSLSQRRCARPRRLSHAHVPRIASSRSRFCVCFDARHETTNKCWTFRPARVPPC